MLKLQTVLSLVVLGGLLAACNSTDALIPRADVGEASFQSPPVTQADLDSMSDPQPVANSRQSFGSSQSTAFADPDPIEQTPAQTAIADGTYVDPAGSLDAQAQQLSARRQSSEASLAEDVQEQRASVQREAEPEPVQQAAEQEPRRQESRQQAALTPSSAKGTIRFLPIIGAPVQAVTPLSKQLGSEARAKGLTIKSSTDPSSDHILKGYFSALSNGDKTTVTYVWDVLDGSGNRLHRIQGQDTVDGAAADPWGAVPASTMQDIANNTMSEYMSWRQSSGI